MSNLVFECPATHDFCDRYNSLFQARQGDAIILFTWQNDSIGVAYSMHFLEKQAHALAYCGSQTCDHP